MNWFKMYPRDFLHGTTHLSCEERGAYIVILCELYDRGGIHANDDRLLAQLWRCDIRVARRLKKTLLGYGKLHLVAGILTNERVQRELKSAELTSNLRSIGGKNNWKINKRVPANPETRYKKVGASAEEVAEKYRGKSTVVSLETAKAIQAKGWTNGG